MSVHPITDVNLRILVCEGLIKYLKDECADDPRQPDALQHYQAQLATLIARRDALLLAQEQPQPPNIVIGLKSANLLGEVKR